MDEELAVSALSAQRPAACAGRTRLRRTSNRGATRFNPPNRQQGNPSTSIEQGRKRAKPRNGEKRKRKEKDSRSGVGRNKKSEADRREICELEGKVKQTKTFRTYIWEDGKQFLQAPDLDGRVLASRDHVPVLVAKSLGREDVSVRAECRVLVRGSVVHLHEQQRERDPVSVLRWTERDRRYQGAD